MYKLNLKIIYQLSDFDYCENKSNSINDTFCTQYNKKLKCVLTTFNIVTLTTFL